MACPELVNDYLVLRACPTKSFIGWAIIIDYSCTNANLRKELQKQSLAEHKNNREKYSPSQGKDHEQTIQLNQPVH